MGGIALKVRWFVFLLSLTHVFVVTFGMPVRFFPGSFLSWYGSFVAQPFFQCIYINRSWRLAVAAPFILAVS